jgi:hypothetical protein
MENKNVEYFLASVKDNWRQIDLTFVYQVNATRTVHQFVLPDHLLCRWEVPFRRAHRR